MFIIILLQSWLHACVHVMYACLSYDKLEGKAIRMSLFGYAKRVNI